MNFELRPSYALIAIAIGIALGMMKACDNANTSAEVESTQAESVELTPNQHSSYVRAVSHL